MALLTMALSVSTSVIVVVSVTSPGPVSVALPRCTEATIGSHSTTNTVASIWSASAASRSTRTFVVEVSSAVAVP